MVNHPVHLASRCLELSIITVTYNSVNEIPNFVRSLDCQQVNYELWLVDNASNDDTPKLLSEIALLNPDVHVVLNAKNIGLAAANNQPLSSLCSRYAAIVNPDVVLHPGALGTLAAYLDNNPDVVAVAPINVDGQGLPHSSFHRSWGLRHLLIWRLFPAPVTQWIYSKVRHYGEQDVLFASGACIMMRTSDLVQIGGYDPEYFLTVEDVCDLCIRLRDVGSRKRVVIVPGAAITHLKSRSGATVPFITLWHGARGSIYHFKKHHGYIAGFSAFLIILLATMLRILSSSLRAPFSSRQKSRLINNMRVLVKLIYENPLFNAATKRQIDEAN